MEDREVSFKEESQRLMDMWQEGGRRPAPSANPAPSYQASVNVYLNDKRIASAPAHTASKRISVAFTDGSVLSVRDEEGAAVVAITSLAITCKDKSKGCQSRSFNFWNQASMTSAGWKLKFTDASSTDKIISKACGNGARWFGWSDKGKDGIASYKFKGSGTAVLDFGNCFFSSPTPSPNWDKQLERPQKGNVPSPKGKQNQFPSNGPAFSVPAVGQAPSLSPGGSSDNDNVPTPDSKEQDFSPSIGKAHDYTTFKMIPFNILGAGVSCDDKDRCRCDSSDERKDADKTQDECLNLCMRSTTCKFVFYDGQDCYRYSSCSRSAVPIRSGSQWTKKASAPAPDAQHNPAPKHEDNSCKGKCGGQALSGCSCAAECISKATCCVDFHHECPSYAAGPSPGPHLVVLPISPSPDETDQSPAPGFKRTRKNNPTPGQNYHPAPKEAAADNFDDDGPKNGVNSPSVNNGNNTNPSLVPSFTGQAPAVVPAPHKFPAPTIEKHKAGALLPAPFVSGSPSPGPQGVGIDCGPTCAGRCGRPSADGSCFCDELCYENDDCCEDILLNCDSCYDGMKNRYFFHAT